MECLSFIYLSSPYTPTANESVDERVEKVSAYAMHLMTQGENVFCPVAHSHYLANYRESVRFSHEFWMGQSIALLQHASRMIVLKLDGWEKSSGIKREIRAAEAMEIPVEFHDYK